MGNIDMGNIDEIVEFLVIGQNFPFQIFPTM